jgi:hypothetical protein
MMLEFDAGVVDRKPRQLAKAALVAEATIQWLRVRPRQRYPRLGEFWISAKVASALQNLRRMRLMDDRTFVRNP